MTFYQVKDGRIIRELPADRVTVEATAEGVQYVYDEVTEQHETTDEQLRLHATMCFDGDCPECAQRCICPDDAGAHPECPYHNGSPV